MAIEIVQITDYDVNNDILLEQFKNKNKFIQICQKLSLESNQIEDCLFEIRDLYWIDTAEGDQLDVLGAIQGIDRDGRTDSEYRKVIKAKIVINNGSGEPETIIKALIDIYGASTTQLIGKAGFLYIWADITLTTTDYAEIQQIVGAGIQLILVAGSSNPFVFYDDPDGDGYGYLIFETLEVDFGSGDEDLEVDFGSGDEVLDVFFDLVNSGMGGEYQSILGPT
jgi:hypothetical protein